MWLSLYGGERRWGHATAPCDAMARTAPLCDLPRQCTTVYTYAVLVSCGASRYAVFRDEGVEMVEELVKTLRGVKWNLVLMAAFCFLFAVYMYVTPVEGGVGMFMITPRNGLVGLLQMLPWIGIFLGAATFVSSFVSTSTWVLGWVEPALGILMFVAGFWELFFPYDIKVFSLAYSFVGIFLAFYVMFIALEIERKRAGNWIATLVLAAVIWVVSFFNMMNFAGEGGSVALTCLQFFLAGWGFVYGALALNGVEPVKGSCPFRCGSKASDAA